MKILAASQYNVVDHQETKKIQPQMVHQLGNQDNYRYITVPCFKETAKIKLILLIISAFSIFSGLHIHRTDHYVGINNWWLKEYHH